MFGHLVALLRIPVDFALPPRCPACGVITPADHLFCAQCWRALDFLGAPACGACGEPLAIDLGPDARCAPCLRDPPVITGMRAAVAYGEIARTLALRLKYAMRPGIAITLARQMRRLVIDHPDALLVPVPLHRWRLWRRGYNQAALIAKALARETGLECSLDLLERRKATPLLRGLGPRTRAQAVRGAFRVRPGRTGDVMGRTILLVDDVYTTGATVNACARLLLGAGAQAVIACCWARVVRDIDNGAVR